MVTTDWTKFREFKDNGLVKDVFSNKSTMDKLTGTGEQGSVQGKALLYRTAGLRQKSVNRTTTAVGQLQ